MRIVRLSLQLLALFSVSAALAELPEEAKEHAVLRGSLKASQFKFEKGKTGHVAFLGGSITQNTGGHSAMIPAWLETRFPDTKFTFNNAGISSTCSTSGAFRLDDHVLSKGQVDLLIVEFAVNDDQDAAHGHQQALRGMEGIVRRLKAHNPGADIVMILYVNPPILEKLEKGQTPVSIAAHSAVAEHYGISTVDVGAALAAGAMNWKTYGGTHPKKEGYRLASDMVIEVLEEAWSTPVGDVMIQGHPIPEPIDPFSYDQGVFADPAAAELEGNWKTGKVSRELLPKGSIRSNFETWNITVGDEPGAEMKLDFEGRGIGAFILAGPDAGILEASIDGGELKPVDLYHRFSKGLNYPRSVMFADELKPGKHRITLRIANRPESSEGGNQAAILHLVVNQ